MIEISGSGRRADPDSGSGMQILLRALVGIVGLVSLLGALMFLIGPEQAAVPFGIVAKGALGMSTLRGDFGALFATIGGLALFAAVTNRRNVLLAPVLLVGCILAGRLVNLTLMGGGTTVMPPLAIEFGLLVILTFGLISSPRRD